MSSTYPWRGVVVATATPFAADLSLDLDRYQEHVAWLAANGCHGVCPNGSLGEYQVLTDGERADVVAAAIEAAPAGFSVIPGVSAYGAAEARRWAEQARDAGADAVLALPPNAYRADHDEVVAHYRAIAQAGLDIVAYNNPHDTRVDLTPELVARLAEIDAVVAVKEFSGDVRRVSAISDVAPRLDVLVGADDVLLEEMTMGAVGWIAGFPNAWPGLCVRMYDLAASGDLPAARALYRELAPAFAWDSRHTFIQAIKLAMDLAGRYGGPCRPPRSPLTGDVELAVRRDIERAVAAERGLEAARAR